MEQKVAYLSQQWRDEAEKRLKAEISPEKMKNLTSSVAYVYVDCPDGRDRYLFFRTVDGTFDQILVGEGEPPESEFRVTGPYDIFAGLTRGTIKSQRALMSGKLKLRGSMVKALKLASLADRINKVLEKIPARY